MNNLKIYNFQNTLIKNNLDIIFIKDDKIQLFYYKIYYLLYKNKLINNIAELFIFSDNNYKILYDNNIKSLDIKKILFEKIKIERGESYFNKLINNIKNIYLFTLDDFISILLKNYTDINEEIITNVYYLITINIFPLLSLNDFIKVVNGEKLEKDGKIIEIVENVINQNKLLEVKCKTRQLSKLNFINLKFNFQISFILKDLNITINNEKSFDILSEFYLTLYENIKITNNTNIVINFVKLNFLNNKLYKYIDDINFLEEIQSSENNLILLIIGEFYVNKIKINDFKIKLFNNYTLTFQIFFIKNIFNKQYYSEEFYKNMILKIFNNKLIKLNIDTYNVLYDFDCDIKFSNFDKTKLHNLIEFFDYYFSVQIININLFQYKFNLIENFNSDKLITSIINYRISNNNKLSENDIKILSNKLQITSNELLSLIDFIDNNYMLKNSKENIIKISLSKILFSGFQNITTVERLIFLFNNIFNIYINNENIQHLKIEKIKNDDYYLSFIYYYKKYETSKYWCKECQNIGLKKRKPEIYQLDDKYSKEFVYNKKTNSYIHPKTKERRFKINNMFIGCSQKNNSTPYIGFLNSCSFCCFSKNQFIEETKSKLYNRLLGCLNIDNSSDTVITNYIYKYPKNISDVVILDPLFSTIFQNEFNNYFFILRKIGNFMFDYNINKLLFIDGFIVNIEAYIYENESITIYNFSYPYLFQIIYIKDIEKIKNYNVEITNDIMNDFLKQTKIKNNIINLNINFFNFFYQYNKNIVHFSFENNNLIFFDFENKFIICFENFNKMLSFNSAMFNNNKYIKKIKLYNYNSKDIQEFIKKNNLIINNILFHNDKIIGIKFIGNIIILFNEIEKIDNNIMIYDKEINTEIILIFFSKDNKTEVSFITKNIKDTYLFYMFKYNFFILLYNNKSIRNNILNLITDDKESTKIKINNYILTNKEFNLKFKENFKIVNKTNYDFNIDNNLSISLKNINFILKIDKNLMLFFIDILSYQLSFSYSSLYFFESRFIDINFSEDNFLDENTFNIKQIIEIKQGKLLKNSYYQEIYLDNSFKQFYRVLANIYFWNKISVEYETLKIENFSNFLKEVNLGFYNIIQDELIDFLYNIIEKQIKKYDNLYIEIVQIFINIYDIPINLILNNKCEISDKTSKYSIIVNGTLNYIIYLALDSKLDI
jgi:hypothetical protein